MANYTRNNLTSLDLNQLPSHMVTNHNIKPNPTEQWRLSNLKFGKLDRKSLSLTEPMMFHDLIDIGIWNEDHDSSHCNVENQPLMTRTNLRDKSVEPKSKKFSEFFVPLRTTTNLNRDTPPNLKTTIYRLRRIETIVNAGDTSTDKEVNPISIAQVTSSKPNDGVNQTNVAANTSSLATPITTVLSIDGEVDYSPIQQVTSHKPSVGVDPTSVQPISKTLSNDKAVDPTPIFQVSPPKAKDEGVAASSVSTITMTNKIEVAPSYFIRSRLRSTQKIRSNAEILPPKTTPKKTVPIRLPNSPKSPKNKARTTLASQLKRKLLEFIRKDIKEGQVIIRQLPIKKTDKVVLSPTTLTTPTKKKAIGSISVVPTTNPIVADTMTTNNDRPKKTYKYNVRRVKPKPKSKKVTPIESKCKRMPKLCELCGGTSTDLNGHVRRIHHGSKDIKCKVCEKKIQSEEQNALHQKTHDLTRKAYDCKVCAESFFTVRQRLRHFIAKHAEKRFICEHCDKKFIGRDKLRNHIGSVHGGPKNYVCEVCGKAYVQQCLLDYHVRGHSDNVRPFCCGYCDSSYTYKYTMLNHVMKVHCTKETAREVKYCTKCLKGYLTVNFDEHECTA